MRDWPSGRALEAKAPVVEPVKPPPEILSPFDPEAPVAPAAWEQLALIAARLAAPAAFLGVLLVPTPMGGGAEERVSVPGVPGMSVVREAGDVNWRVIETTLTGQEEVAPQKPDGLLRDVAGAVIGRVLPNGALALDLHSVWQTAQSDEPRLVCPPPEPDRWGAGPNSDARHYEDLIKQLARRYCLLQTRKRA